ncbi:hypothetical protein JKP88DRAFT_299219 [Tribonema minus]|uniref:Uncharacterized protein n=1 Tax=Tribonema minus TaxID=303371 RepID=A0A836CP25_9STRA|nr:hypothetical protein JKP88DRAFT_299219 [Tribonema minus]
MKLSSCLTAAVIGVACISASAAAASALNLQPEAGGIEGVEASGAAQRALANDNDDTMIHDTNQVDEDRKLPGDGKKLTNKARRFLDAAPTNQFDLGPQFKKIQKFRCPGNNYIIAMNGTANKVLNSVTSFKCMPSKKTVNVSIGATTKGLNFTVTSAAGFRVATGLLVLTAVMMRCALYFMRRSFKGGYSSNGNFTSSITFYKDRLFVTAVMPTLGSQQKDGTALSPWLCDQVTN